MDDRRRLRCDGVFQLGPCVAALIRKYATTPSMSRMFTNHGDTKMATKCFYRDKEYASASDALEAYIRDFDGRSSAPASTEKDVQELLTVASSCVLERETEKMQRMKCLVDESYQQLIEKRQTGQVPPLTTSSTSSSSSSASAHWKEVVSRSQVGSVPGDVIDMSTVADTKFKDFRKSLSHHEGTGLKLLAMDNRDSTASSILAGHLASIQPKSKMASTPIRSPTTRHLDPTKSSLTLSDLKNFPGFSTDDIATRSRSQSRSNADRSRSLSAAACTDPILTEPEIVNTNHQRYLDSLMNDIEKSSSSISPEMTLKSSANKSVRFWDEHSKEYSDHSFGYLERVQRLIQEPEEIPNSSECALSLNTEEILEGDRSWERIPPVNLDELAVEGGGGEELAKVTDANVDAILDECLSLVSLHDQEGKEETLGLSGGSQPGGMEALKNMLFTMQGLTDEVSVTSASQEGPKVTKEGSGHRSSLPLRHMEKMERAMDSLSRLKSLVSCQKS